MDLESECSVHESVEDNDVIITPERLDNIDGNKIENNGSFGGEYGDNSSMTDREDKDVRVRELVSSPPLAGSVGSPPPPATTKGYGLKKWRRIRREVNKDGSSSSGDTNKILKRALSTSMVNSSKPQSVSIESRPKSDGSLSSTNAILKSMGVAAGDFALHGSNLDSRGVVGPSFAAGMESENSEDRSSRSSTAASVPKLRYEKMVVGGSANDKNRLRTLSGKNLVTSVQRGPQGKSRAETSKKHRGEGVKIGKENSHSSLESDSRSSNFVFMQGTETVTSNGRQSGKAMHYDGENSDEVQDGEQHSDEDLGTSHTKDKVGEFEDLLCENHRTSTDRDPLAESIYTLRSAQEELEKELQKLREIGTEHVSLFGGSTKESSSLSEFDSLDSRIDEATSSGITRSSSHLLETRLASLKQSTSLLESKLEEANNMIKVNEAKVVELEYALKSNEEMPSTVESQYEKYRDMEAELEGLFKQKIEAEVEYLAIASTNHKLRVATMDQVAPFEEQRTLASEQAQMLNELGDLESKAEMLKRQAKKLETCYEDVVETEQVLKLQKRVCKVTTCLCMQFILLVVVFAIFILQLSPHYEGVVPT